MVDEPPGRLPKLAVVFEPHTVKVLALVEAAAQTWETIWLVDRAVEHSAEEMRALRRFGSVVDITNLSSRDIASVLDPLSVGGIIAFEDAELMRAAHIGELLGLSFFSPDVAHRLTSKAAQRDAFAAAGLVTPRYWVLHAADDRRTQIEIAQAAHYPAVLKPLSGTGSRNVFLIPDAAALMRILSEWPEASSGTRADLILEEKFPDGWPRAAQPYADYVTVESVASRGRISHVAVTGRMPMVDPFRQTGSFIPTNLPPDLVQTITTEAGRAIAALGATVGIFHTEVKMTPQGPRVVEVNGRVGGGGVPEILALVADHSMLNLAGRVALGQEVFFESLVPCSELGYYYRYQAPLGACRLTRLDRVSDVGHLPGVRELFVNRRPGDRVDDWRNGSAGFLFSILGTADDHATLWRRIQKVHEVAQVEYAPV